MNKISCNTCLDLMPLVKMGLVVKTAKKISRRTFTRMWRLIKIFITEFKHMEIEDLDIE